MIFCHPEDATSGRSVEDADFIPKHEYSWYDWLDDGSATVPAPVVSGPVVATDAPRDANDINT
jgi:hypothetical protein